MKLTNIQKNEIATEYQQWQNSFASSVSLLGEITEPIYKEYESLLYSWITDERTRSLLSLMHSNFVTEFKAMNTRLPTTDNSAHFWADNSRHLIATIGTSENLIKLFKNNAEAFEFDDKIKKCIDLCKSFLEQYQGSLMPPHTDKMPIYLELPIFIRSNKPVILESKSIQKIDVIYVRGLFERTQDDFANGHFDSVITKCRTLLEEVFCYAIENKEQTPSVSGKISDLWNEVKELYNMRQTENSDKRLNDLVTGLWKIIESVATIRNIGSDSHGVGSSRRPIRDYYATLYLNSTITVASFIVSVVENSNRK